MISEVHQIQSNKLKPYIQYILYNRRDVDAQHSVTSFPNTNICLGISKGNILTQEDNTFVGKPCDQNDIFVYTTGLYTSPHEFKVEDQWDEICIDFNPCGYYHFFNFPSKPKIIAEGFANSFFSKGDKRSFEQILNEDDLKIRSLEIEKLLLAKLRPFEKSNLQLAIEFIHTRKGMVSVKEVLKYTRCSERKMYQLFMDHFKITPKWYIRIVKIRQALQLITFKPFLSLTEIAYECGYTDQSHFIKEAKSMCNILPKALKNELELIDNKVIICRS
ncbi:MAG: helix-turn-helix transcriptional regulator [Bacteroidota bacterium]